MPQLLSPQNNTMLTLLQPDHLRFVQEPAKTLAADVDWLRLKEEKIDRSYPVPVDFSFSPATDGVVILYHPCGRITRHAAHAGRAKVANLRIGATYEWQVEAEDDLSPVYRFFTADQPPRMLYVDGISNVRDFGGYTTKDGKRVRQGLLYRTSEMDTHVAITEMGKTTLYELGIRTDLDIRGCNDEYRAPALDETRVKWINIPMVAYDKIFTDKAFIKAYGDGYALLADQNRYPVIVHCWGGIDRTGCFLFILGGALGVEPEQLYLDYELSSFSRWGRRSRHSDQFRAFHEGLMAYGDTVETACRNFMLAGGITERQIQQIKDIFLENMS